MSAHIKKAGRIGTKIVAAFLFLFLIMFNVEVGLYDAESSESGILGLTMGVFVQSVEAGSIVVCAPTQCREGGGGWVWCHMECSDGSQGNCWLNGDHLCDFW